MASNTNAELCQSKDGLVGSDEGIGSPVAILCDELRRMSENAERSQIRKLTQFFSNQARCTEKGNKRKNTPSERAQKGISFAWPLWHANLNGHHVSPPSIYLISPSLVLKIIFQIPLFK